MSTTETTTCKRCEGTGYLSMFAHVEFGKCFACDGRGTRNFATERASKKAHAENLAKVNALPTRRDMTGAFMLAGLRYRKADQLGNAWLRAQSMTVWGEELTPEHAALAAEAEAILTGVAISEVGR